MLIAVPAVAGLFFWSWRVKQKLMRQFVTARLFDTLVFGYSAQRQKVRLCLLVAAVAALLFALARPQWGYAWEEAHVKGLDIIVALDTSRSMLAQDVAPDRLEKAKLAVYDLMRLAKNDRLGLVVFAGNAFLQTPLTLDDQAFRQGLDAVNVGIIPQGGTSLSSAIRTSLEAFEKGNDNHKVLVLFTDGEDHDADTETMAAAKEAADAGMHIFTIGVGTPAGELIRVTDDQGNASYIKDEDGNVVKSHLNQPLLEQIATVTHGFYLPLQGADPMSTLYAQGLAPLPTNEGATRQARIPLERYKWPLSFAILCLVLEFLIPESPRRIRRNETSAASSKTTLQQTAVMVCVLFLTLAAKASPSDAYHDYQNGKYKSAFEEYNRLSGINSNDYRLHYDAGDAAYKAKELEKAEQQFNETLASPTVVPDVQTQERTHYNLGNTQFHLGETLKDSDEKEARWGQAVTNYMQALQLAHQLNTNDVEAQNNLAYVQQQLQQLKQQQQQQNKDQDKDKKDNKDQQNQDNKQNQQNQDQKDKKDQKQQQQNQQQQSGKNQKSGQDKKDQEEKKRQREQAKKDQEKKEREQQAQQAKQGEKKDQQQEQQPTEPGQMTPEEARQILNSDKDGEKALIFQPTNQPATSQPGKFKNW
jgi:Ca-activated chloride channel family protein